MSLPCRPACLLDYCSCTCTSNASNILHDLQTGRACLSQSSLPSETLNLACISAPSLLHCPSLALLSGPKRRFCLPLHALAFVRHLHKHHKDKGNRISPCSSLNRSGLAAT